LQLHMQAGPKGHFDQRAQRSDSPVHSVEGRRFLIELCTVTKQRIDLSLDATRGRTMTDFWDRFRLRAPDAARIMWAAGALRWRNASLQAGAAQVVTRDIACPFNLPRYITTALWGAAWAHPEQPLTSLCNTVESQPQDFWRSACLPVGLVYYLLQQQPRMRSLVQIIAARQRTRPPGSLCLAAMAACAVRGVLVVHQCANLQQAVHLLTVSVQPPNVCCCRYDHPECLQPAVGFGVLSAPPFGRIFDVPARPNQEHTAAITRRRAPPEHRRRVAGACCAACPSTARADASMRGLDARQPEDPLTKPHPGLP
jgi:hypothetical protein